MTQTPPIVTVDRMTQGEDMDDQLPLDDVIQYLSRAIVQADSYNRQGSDLRSRHLSLAITDMENAMYRMQSAKDEMYAAIERGRNE